MSNYFLEHYGVAGMRWGKRNTRRIGQPVIELGPGEYRDSSGTNSKKTSSKKSSSNSNSSKTSSSSSKTSSNKNNSNNNNDSKPNTNPVKTPESKKLDLKSTQEGIKDSKKLVDAGAKYLDDDRKKQSIKDLKADAKTMSDDELRTVINRLSMEERYISVMEKEGAVRAKTDLQKTLEIVGNIAAYADTAISVYDRIQDVRAR